MTDQDRREDTSEAGRVPRVPDRRRTGPAWASPPRPPAPGQTPGYKTGGPRLALLIGGTLAVGLVWGWPVLLMVVGLVVMIFLHELGHYVTAKWSGMKVTEFFLGFGPRIWSVRRGETEYGVKVLPAGAFVRIVGMNNLDEVDPADEPRTYRQQSFPKRLLVVSAGSLMHFAQAWLALVVLFAVVGMPGGSLFDPDEDNWTVGHVSDDSAAASARLEPGDRIVGFDGHPVETFEQLTGLIRGTDVGEEVTLTVERAGERFDTTTEIVGRPEDAGGTPGAPFLGVGPDYQDKRLGLLDAVGQASVETPRMAAEAVGAMVGFFSPNGLGDFASNVSEGGDERADRPTGESADDDREGNRLLSILGVVRLGASAVEEDGIAPFLFIFFQINVFIGLLNMVPLPPLDGGHAAVAIYERIRSRKGRRYHADMAKLLPVTYAVAMALIVLGTAAIYLDIVAPLD